MAKVLDLNSYRRDKRRDYRAKYEARVEKFIAQFVNSRLFLDFIQLAHSYISQHMDHRMQSWDYLTLRETLQEAMGATIAAELMQQLRMQYWYDEKWMSQDEVIDRTLSAFVLGTAQKKPTDKKTKL